MARATARQADCPEHEGLRERKKLATRRALGIAAMRLAIERGLDNVLVEEIAAVAGVSTRTFNNYFGSKYEAICALAMERGRQVGEAVRRRAAAEPLAEAITQAVLEQYGSSEQAPDKDWITGLRLVVQSPALQGEFLRTQHAAQHALAEAIADRIGAGEDDMLPAVVAGAVSAATGVAMERWLRADPPTAIGPLIRQALSQLSDPRLTGLLPGVPGVQPGGHPPPLAATEPRPRP